MKKKWIFICFLFLPCILFAFGRKEKSKTTEVVSGQVVEIVGKVRLVGNMPFFDIVITDHNDEDWFIFDENDKKIFQNYDQQTVTVRAQTEFTEMRKYLKNITLLTPPTSGFATSGFKIRR